MNKMRAPEELMTSDQYIHRNKADVWSLGDMMYNVLTNRWMFEGISTSEAKAKMLAGQWPSFPRKFANSTDPSEQAMIKAIQMAWTYDPNDRPAARKIADYLKKHMMDQKEGGSSWRVSIPPLPPNYSHSDDSDYMANLLAR